MKPGQAKKNQAKSAKHRRKPYLNVVDNPRAQDPEAWGRVSWIGTVSIYIPNPYRWFMSLVHSRQRSKGSPIFLNNEVWDKVFDEVKFLLSASQKHGAECPELRFILLMFHGIHPVEDSEADKLLRSSIYQRSIIGNERVARARWRNVCFVSWSVPHRKRALGRVRAVSLNRIASHRRSRENNYVVDSERPISRSVESVFREEELF